MTFKVKEGTRLGACIDDKIVDLNLAYARYLADEKGEVDALREATSIVPPSMLSFLDNGDDALEAASTAVEYVSRLLRSGETSDLRKAGVIRDFSEELLTAPIPRPRKNIFCLGLNYAEHVAESDQARGALPAAPVFFTKPPTAANGPFDPIIYPKATKALDYEVELAVVIGKKGKYIPQSKAYDHIVGYMAFNDVTARDLQRGHGGQWFKGKGLDTFAPMGPWIITKDEVENIHNVDVSLKVNGEQRQHSNTKNLIFNIPTIIEVLSAGLTLEPGDIIATGTPSGVGYAMKPPGLLKVGDIVEATVESIGTLRNKVVAE